MANIHDQDDWPAATDALVFWKKCCKRHGRLSPEAKAAAATVVMRINSCAAQAGKPGIDLSLMGY